MRASPLRAALCSVGLLAATASAILIGWGVLTVNLWSVRHWPIHWHRLCRLLLGMEVRQVGKAETAGPVLYVCNHASYLDVTALGSVLRASFVAKAEVRDWPVIGFLCRLQHTVFVDRRVSASREHRTALHQRLQAGDSLILFPEGTSGDGNHILPFKSTLFSVAEARCNDAPVKVQPVTIAYCRLGGVAMGRVMRPCFAWYGEMTLFGHLWRCLGLGGLGVDVIFHDPVCLDQFASRKALARHCQDRIARGLSDALAGRLGLQPVSHPTGTASGREGPARGGPAQPSVAGLESAWDI